jgi:hypothetical protein
MARFNDYPEWPDEGDGHYHPPQNMEIPEWTLKAGFVDESWHNDAAARMRWKTSAGVFLWVSEAKPEQRECGGLRYGLTVEVPDGWPELHGDSFVETDDSEEVLRFLEKPSIAFTVARAQAEICSDIDQWISEGHLQTRADIKDYSDLHDFCDANGYGGAFEEWAWPEDERGVGVNNCEYWETVQARLDEWIKDGFVLAPDPKPVKFEACPHCNGTGLSDKVKVAK